jgi:hypothetical protein
MAVLVDLLPDVRDFVALDIRHHHVDMDSIEKRPQHTWCCSVESMTEFTSDINTKTLLASGIYSRLTRIAMEGEEGEPVDDFIRLLDNAPALRTLDMSQYYISLEDLELLHKTVAHLTALILETIEFDCTSLPSNIEPASTVKVLKINSSGMYAGDGSITHLQYLMKKYTNLAEFSYDIISFDHDETESETQYKASMASYMKVLGPQLHTLSLHLESERPNPFAMFDFVALDKGQCQIRHLSLGLEIRSSMLDQLV